MPYRARLCPLRRHLLLAALLCPWMTAAQDADAGGVLVLGDSLSAEYGLARGSGWVALLEQRLHAEGLGHVRVLNASISGETTAGGRSRLAALLARHRPDVLVLELGANDALRGLPLEGTKSNLQAMVRAAHSSGARTLLLGMQVPPNYGSAYAQQFAGLFAKVAEEDKTALVPFLLAGLADAPDAPQWFQSDRLHPTAAAQARMLDNVWPALHELIDKKK